MIKRLIFKPKVLYWLGISRPILGRLRMPMATPFILGKDSIHYDAPFFYAFLKGKWEVYNQLGSKLSDKAYQHISAQLFSMIPVKNHQFWGFLDFKGDEIISLKYDSIGAGYHHKMAINYLGKVGRDGSF